MATHLRTGHCCLSSRWPAAAAFLHRGSSETVQNGERKRGRLAGAGLGDATQVTAGHRMGDCL